MGLKITRKRNSDQGYTNMHADYSSQGFDQLLDVIDKIKNNPDDCRIILSAWNPSDLKQITLTPCHMFAQFYVNQGELSCQMYKLSADMGIGVPFNIICYQHAWSPMFVILKINSEKKDIHAFVVDDFKLIGYDPHQKIKMEMAV